MKIAREAVVGKTESVVELAQHLHDYVRAAAEQAVPLHEVERFVLGKVLEIGFVSLENFIAQQGDGDLGVTLVIAGRQSVQRSAEPVERRLRTVFGEHVFQAYVYAPGVKAKIALRPVDARMALPAGRYSYFFEEIAQYFCVEQAFGLSASAIATVLGQEVPVDSLERLNRRVGQQAAAFLEELPAPSVPEGDVLVVSADGKGIPLVDADAQRVPVFETLERPGNRRMATLGCVYSVDRYERTPEQIVAALFRDDSASRPPKRPTPQGKRLLGRFTCLVEEATDEHGQPLVLPGPIATLSWANEEVRQRHSRRQPAVRLMDGQASLWEAAAECLDALPAEEWIDILDVIHVSSYVWRAAKVFYAQHGQRETFVRERCRLRILQGETAGVITGMRRMASQRDLSAAGRKEIATVCRYFHNNRERMRYDVYLREGYPIATGVIEGACRHLVKDRLERSGMRWALKGAQAMLDVRAVFQSTDWETFLTTRIVKEQELLHPHRDLLADYTPFCLAA